MPQNKRGGKKFKRGKKRPQNSNKVNLIYAGDGQTYAMVKKREGGTRLSVECSDGKIRSGIIPGKFRKRVWMNPGDVILVSLNVNSSDKSCTIDHKYNQAEVSALHSQGIISFEDIEDRNIFEFKTDAMDFSDIHDNNEELPSNPDYTLPIVESEELDIDNI